MGTQYATLADLESVGLPPLALQGRSDEQKTQALIDASAMVDSYLSTRFTLPLTTFGRDIVRATLAIVAYDLLYVRGFQPGANDSDATKTRYDDAVKWLRDVAGGKATPAFADTTDREGFDPSSATKRFTIQQVGGGIGLSDSEDGADSGSLGTIRAPKSRGW